MKRGFSLLECLVSMSLFLFVLTASVQFYLITRNQFIKLKDAREEQEAVAASLEKIRMDLREAGRGLKTPVLLGLLSCLETDGGKMTLVQSQSFHAARSDLFAGQTRIPLLSTTALRKNRRVCIFNRTHGEMREILRIEGKDCILKNPLQHPYPAAEVSAVQIKKIAYYLDTGRNILRRKVNAAPAQPLLENTSLFLPEFNMQKNLVRIRLALMNKEEKIHETSFYPKNTSFSILR